MAPRLKSRAHAPRGASGSGEAHAWPPIALEPRVWQSAVRAGSRADRLFRSYESALVPRIASRTPGLGARAIASLSEATAAIAALDAAAELDVGPLWSQMLRSESVASSKIENIYTRQEELAAALAGARASKAARDVAAHVDAIERLVRAAETGAIATGDILRAHSALLAADAVEGAHAGRFRTVQNWIGGSDETPRDALYVPPAAAHVEPLMNDLVDFVARDDLPPVVQAAIAHAQFETIHPFTDGNGRIGRALVHAIMRRRKLTSRTIVPVATALLADPEVYFDGLTLFRLEGDVEGFVELFSARAAIAAVESRVAARDLIALPGRWREEARPRRGSMMGMLFDVLVEQPVIDVEKICALTGSTPRAAYDVIEKLEALAILKEITNRKRDRLWSAPDVFEIIDSLEKRIGRRKLPRLRGTRR